MAVLDMDPPLAALKRLVNITKGDTGQSKRVASFLLAWWNASECGGFDLTDLWAVDRAVADDIILVIGLIALRHNYPDAYGYREQFETMVSDWRPKLVQALDSAT